MPARRLKMKPGTPIATWLATQERYYNSYPPTLPDLPFCEEGWGPLPKTSRLLATWRDPETQRAFYDILWSHDLVPKDARPFRRQTHETGRSKRGTPALYHVSRACLSLQVHGHPARYAEVARQVYDLLLAKSNRTDSKPGWMVEIFDPDYLTDYFPRMISPDNELPLEQLREDVWTVAHDSPGTSLSSAGVYMMRRPEARNNEEAVATVAVTCRAGSKGDWDALMSALNSVLETWRMCTCQAVDHQKAQQVQVRILAARRSHGGLA